MTLEKGHSKVALLLIAIVCCCCCLTHAAKITTKTINASAASPNATSIELLTAAAIKETKTTTTRPFITAEDAASDEEEEEEDDDDNDDDEEDENDDELVGAGAPSTALAAVEKNGGEVATVDATSAFSFWGVVRNVWSWIKDDLSESLLGDDSGGKPPAAIAGRTFGKIRRLQMALIPLIFKFGILSAMVAFLVVLGMKTLFLVKLLVLMNAVAILAKFLTIKANYGHVEHSAPPAWSYNNWNPHAHSGWAATAPAAPAPHAPSKEIHLHIHGGQVQPQAGNYAYGVGAQGPHSAHGWESRSDPYGAYAPAPVSEADVENELNNGGPLAQLPSQYPTNHRRY